MKIRKLQEYIRKEIVSAFEKDSLKERIPRINVDAGNPLLQKIVLTNDVLRFASADVELTQDVDRKVLRMMGSVLEENADIFESITIEGHADTVPINKGCYPTNWELSAGRATTVVRFLADSIGFNPHKLISAGFSSYHPINPDSIHLNRRIEAVVRYSYDRKFMHSGRAKEIYRIMSQLEESEKKETKNSRSKNIERKHQKKISDNKVAEGVRETDPPTTSFHGIDTKKDIVRNDSIPPLRFDVDTSKKMVENQFKNVKDTGETLGVKKPVHDSSAALKRDARDASSPNIETAAILRVLRKSDNFFGKSDAYIIYHTREIIRSRGNDSQKNYLCYQLRTLTEYAHLDCRNKLKAIDAALSR